MARSIISLDSITGSYDVSSNLLVNTSNLIVSGSLSVTGSTYLKSTQIDGSLTANAGISGSLTKLSDGTSYLIASSSIQISSSSNGSVSISSTATGSVSVAAYSGYCSGSLLWNSATWADFHTVPSNFIDTIQNGITRSNSTFTVVSGGVYFFHSDFNHENQLTYTGWRLSGSNGTIIQQTSYGSFAPLDGDGADLAGIFILSASDSFNLQYIITAGSAQTWASSDPIDGENMRSGVVNIFRIGDA